MNRSRQHELDQLVNQNWRQILNNRPSSKRLGRRYDLTPGEVSYVRSAARAIRDNSDRKEDMFPSPLEQARVSDNYYYNESTGDYVFNLPNVTQLVSLGGATVENLVRMYSNMGEAATINECERTMGLPRPYIVKILRALGVTHDSLPFTKEAIASRGDEDLVDEAVALRQAKLHNKIQRKNWDLVKKNAEKWQHFEQTTLEEIKNVVRELPDSRLSVEVTPYGHSADEDFLLLVSPTDFHFGSYGDPFEVGEVNNRDLQRAKLLRATNRVLDLAGRLGAPESILFTVGSDYLHIDNEHKTTTRGTPQDTDGNPKEILKEGFELKTEFVDTLRSRGVPVTGVAMAGNHDSLTGMALLMYLDAWYKDAEDTTIRVCGRKRQYMRYGNTLICFAHSDGVSKTADLASIASAEVPELWGSSKHRVCFTGHLHHELVQETRGFVRYQLPSLAGKDRFHTNNGYIGSRKCLAGVVIGKKSGVIATFYHNE